MAANLDIETAKKLFLDMATFSELTQMHRDTIVEKLETIANSSSNEDIVKKCSDSIHIHLEKLSRYFSRMVLQMIDGASLNA